MANVKTALELLKDFLDQYVAELSNARPEPAAVPAETVPAIGAEPARAIAILHC
jgi:hypothetical protein